MNKNLKKLLVLACIFRIKFSLQRPLHIKILNLNDTPGEGEINLQ